MGNPYYRSGSQRAPQVRALFAAIAKRYDLINDVQSLGLHRYWKNQLIQQAAPQPQTLALDVCTGTGDIALRLQNTGATTVAVDFSLPMLGHAQQRTPTSSHPIPWIAADALKLPFQDNIFDCVTIAYGLRNLPDFAGGLRELNRVAKPNGKLLILDFGKPTSPAWRTLYFAYLKLVIPILGRLLCQNADAYAYILESLKHYPDHQAIQQLLQSNGWKPVKLTRFLGGIMTLHLAQKINAPA
jgi:demethylmenaquinone methyltransferase/2-methoxy-6-polyprenyl-1,4-benzoquinol methylase